MAEREVLIPLPAQSGDVPWPTRVWPRATLPGDVDADRVARLVDRAFADREVSGQGRTLALLVVHRGRLVLERYEAGKNEQTSFRSWSMAKSMLHALIGMRVAEGRLDLHAKAPVPAWQGDGDARAAITLEHLLRMVDGLDFVEQDDETGRVDVAEMIGGAGKHDVAAYAEALPFEVQPGTRWRYSSAASVILCGILARTIGGGAQAMEAFMRRRLFDPLGMHSAKPRFDAAGTFIGSSFVFATAPDFARFGLLYLRDGQWGDDRLLPEGWVDHARTPTPASRGEYGAHWWLAQDGSGAFSANGWHGQHILVVPGRDLVVVRLGSSTLAERVELVHGLKRLVECFPLVA